MVDLNRKNLQNFSQKWQRKLKKLIDKKLFNSMGTKEKN